MSGITRNDLQKKTQAQLSALFNATRTSVPRHDPERARTLSLLAMIRAELARRDPQP